MIRTMNDNQTLPPIRYLHDVQNLQVYCMSERLMFEVRKVL